MSIPFVPFLNNHGKISTMLEGVLRLLPFSILFVSLLSVFTLINTNIRSPHFSITLKNFPSLPWLVWLSGLSTGLHTKRVPVRFPYRAHSLSVRAPAWIAGQVPSWGRARGNQLASLSHIDVSLPLFLSPFLSH